MDVASLIIAVTSLVLALLIAGFGVLLQFLMFKASSEQTTAVGKSLGDFQSELQHLLGQIEGRTDAMTTTLNEQFNTMLDAFVRRPATISEAAREASNAEASSRDALALADSLQGEFAGPPDMEAFASKVDEMKRAIRSARESAETAARLTEGMKVSQFMSQYWIEGGFGAKPGGAKAFTVDVGGLLREVREANRGGGAGLDPGEVGAWHKPLVVADPGSVLTGCLEDGLVMVSTDVDSGQKRVALTPAGAALLELIESPRATVPE